MKTKSAAETNREKNTNLGKHGTDAALNAGHIKSSIPKNHLGSRSYETEAAAKMRYND